MWIEELLEDDRPISIRFRDIRKTDASGSIRPSASTAGLKSLLRSFRGSLVTYGSIQKLCKKGQLFIYASETLEKF